MSHSPPKWVFSRMHRTTDLNARQHAIIDVWEAWLAEGEGDLEVEGFTVPKILDDLWALSVQYKKPSKD